MIYHSRHEDIDFEEFQSIMQHLPPSVLFVVLKNADNRSSSARSILSMKLLIYRMGRTIW